MNAEDYIYIKNYLPKKLCQDLIEECNKKKWVKHRWYDSIEESFSTDLNKELDVMDSTEEQIKKIKFYLIKALNDYQKKYSAPGESYGTKPPWLNTFSPIRFNKYEVGNTMREHYDHIRSLFDGKIKGIPIISIVANLNEDYEGAEFYCRGKEINLKTGDILLFPSNFMYPHEVKETKKGTRYSFVSWAF